MRRVYIMYGRSFVLENGHYIFAFVILCVLLSSVSLGNLFQNMPKGNIYDSSVFVESAVINTETFTKLLLGCLLLSAGAPLFRIGFKYLKKISLRPTFAFLQGQ